MLDLVSLRERLGAKVEEIMLDMVAWQKGCLPLAKKRVWRERERDGEEDGERQTEVPEPTEGHVSRVR